MDSSLANMKVALLHSGHHHHARVAQIARRLAPEANVIDVDANRLTPNQLAGCDLVLLEAFEPDSPSNRHALNRVRAGTRAPLVLLTNTRQPDHTIAALEFGADAVIPLHSHNEVILAHCQALLRRWRSAGMAAA